jgi:hypothetical protein
MVIKLNTSYIVNLSRPTVVFWYCVRLDVSTHGGRDSFDSMGCSLMNWISHSTGTAAIIHRRSQSGIFSLDALFPALSSE